MLVNGRMIAELGGMDEDFFLYHEEVAFSRAAHDHGWRVEYDPNVKVIHRHPLQNRAVSPRMRVITRHSKLLYFRKHLPRWQFLGLSWIVTLEAVVRGVAARITRGAEPERAWRTVGQIARLLRRGEDLRSQDVRELADAVELSQRERTPLGNRLLPGLDRSSIGDHHERHVVPAVAREDQSR